MRNADLRVFFQIWQEKTFFKWITSLRADLLVLRARKHRVHEFEVKRLGRRDRQERRRFADQLGGEARVDLQAPRDVSSNKGCYC